MLTKNEEDYARSIGTMRAEACRTRGAKHLYLYSPTPELELSNNIHSAIAEATVAKEIKRRWLSIGNKRDESGMGDVEFGVSVRWTPYITGRLIIYKADLEPYSVLVVGYPPMKIIGWVHTKQAKRPLYWTTKINGKPIRFPTYMVEQGSDAFNPIWLLKQILDEEYGPTNGNWSLIS